VGNNTNLNRSPERAIRLLAYYQCNGKEQYLLLIIMSLFLAALSGLLRCGWTLPHPVGAGDSVKNPDAPIGANIKNKNSTDILPQFF
jgi:hypothetical protein